MLTTVLRRSLWFAAVVVGTVRSHRNLGHAPLGFVRECVTDPIQKGG